MDKTILYKKLDIDRADEFRFYENLSSLLEEDDFIEENLIADLLSEIDRSQFSEHLDLYFEEFLKNLPDDENELYITVDNIFRHLSGLVAVEMTREEIVRLAAAIGKFRKWYVHDLTVSDRISGEDISVRDARYNILAAKFLGEDTDYDFSKSCEFVPEGYDVLISAGQPAQL
jgi:hypothetical protein